MLPVVGSHRFLLRLRVPPSPSESQRVERVLATARVFLGTFALLAVYLDPTEPSQFAAPTYLLLVAYLLYCLVLLLLLRLRRESTPSFRLCVHAVDIFWAAFITLFTEGPASPFFIFFVFVLLAAAYRWGFPASLLTAAAAVVLLFLESTSSIWPGFIGRFLDQKFYLNRYILLATYLFVMGFLLGYLAEAEKLLRSEISAIARIMRNAQEEQTLVRTLQVISDEVMRVFGANLAFFVMKETYTERVFLWEAQHSDQTRQTRLRTSEVEPAQREAYFFAPEAKSMRALNLRRGGNGNSFEIFALSGARRRLRDIPSNAPDPFFALHPFRSLLSVSFSSGDEWSGRLFLIDPSPEACGEEAMGFLQAMLFQLAPTVYSVYLLRRIRTRVGVMERTRIAREIHDGPIQSLIGVEMQVDVLRRQAARDPATASRELTRIQQLLRQEVLGLRELMQKIKPLDVGPRQLISFLAELVERFGHETGISVKFVPETEEISLAPRACREVARIVQEALVNVRKHSDAANVFIRLASQNGNYRLEIDDDGRGFDFSGRYSQAQLDAIQKGPAVIKERVRSIGGELVIESNPGRGVRLEIEFPQRLYG